MNNFQEYFVDIYKYKYADFSGRARRSEYWYFVLFNILVLIGLAMVGGALAANGNRILSRLGFIPYMIFALAMIIPSLAVAVRRLHDTGKSGWMYLISFIPVIGSIILLVFFCTEGTPGTNKWGKNPKEIDLDDVSDHLIDTL